MSQNFNSEARREAEVAGAARRAEQENQADSPAWQQMMNAAVNLANQAAQQMTTPEPSPALTNPVLDNPPLVASRPDERPAEEAPPAGERQAAAQHEAPTERSAEAAPGSDNSEVEYINGHTVGFAFLRYYKAHPEIGLPVDDQHGDVGGSQVFEHAVLHWDGANVRVENRG